MLFPVKSDLLAHHSQLTHGGFFSVVWGYTHTYIQHIFFFQNAIANASSLAEVERLKGMLQAGQIPGRDLRQGQSLLIYNLHTDGDDDYTVFLNEPRYEKLTVHLCNAPILCYWQTNSHIE